MRWTGSLRLAAKGMVLGSLLAVAAAPAGAETLDALVAKGKVAIGVMSGIPPYDSIDADGNTVGYHVDVANMIGKALGVEVELVPVNNASRIAALQSGRVDILVAQTTATPERAKAVMFTAPYGSYIQAIVARKDVAITTLDDLANKSVSVPKGSVQDLTLSSMNIPGLRIERFDDDALAMQALLSGQVDSTVAVEVMTNDLFAKRGITDYEIKVPLYKQYFSIGVRQGDFELLQWLNNFIFHVNVTGDLEKVHEKWTGVGMPGGPLPAF